MCNRTEPDESSKSRLSLISGKCGNGKMFWRKHLQTVTAQLYSRALRVPYGTDAGKSSWLPGCRLWVSRGQALCSRSEFLKQRYNSLIYSIAKVIHSSTKSYFGTFSWKFLAAVLLIILLSMVSGDLANDKRERRSFTYQNIYKYKLYV